uniref:Putative armc3 n=1 Tax=Schistosoma mansoni TaxID=6183 RepID=A0A5K4EJN1_SCHMA
MTAGKKSKRDDISAADSFDEVVVGLHQAESAVLMLKSPEDDVKTRACEALYKFSNKSDENKKALISLNILEYLQPLIRDENRVVKRNAVLVYGVLSSLPSARSIIRKLPNIVTDLLKLLDSEEFETTKEFTAMTLSHLCLEYAGIYELIEHKCFSVITPCLKSPDPDVQKNTLDIIYMLLQDFEARPMLKASEGLETLIELLVSEYPVIQDLVLKVFARATQDSIIKTALRDMNALDAFVDIIGVPEFNDIHVSALQVIANLLNDTECVKHLVSQGSLQKLLHFITDRQVYNESDIKVNSANQQQNKDKNAKGRKPSPKKSDKKKSSKGDSDGKKDEEKPPSNTLPEAKIHTCNALMRAACKEETRKILHDADVERMLVSLLSHEDEGVRSASAQVIAILSESSVCQDRIAELEVASRNSGLEALLSCLHMSDPEVDSITVGGLVALTNLAIEETTRPKVLHVITAKLFIPTLNSNSVLTQSKAALAVASLISEPHTVQQFVQLGGLSSLLNLIQSTNNDVRRSACWAIASLTADHTAAVTLSQLNGITILQTLNESITRKNTFTELALKRVLDANLMAKFALTGYLDFVDHIPDLFYDPGQITNPSQFLTLDEYNEQSVNDRRPIFLINLQKCDIVSSSDCVQSQVSSDAKTDDLKQDDLNYFNEMKYPFDSTLHDWLNTAVKQITPINELKEQIKSLGEFVASCYGGSVSKDEQITLRNELSLSQLRCQLNSNLIPVGLIKQGSFLQRALVFKLLADRIGLPTNLIRGTYGRSFNEVLIEPENSKSQTYRDLYVVDLMFEPGKLLKSSTSEALEYTSIAC